MIAAIEGRSEIIKLLVSHSTNNQHTDDMGFNALTLAVTAHHIHDDTITLLLQHSNTADINSALYVSAEAGHVSVVSTLLSEGADVNTKQTSYGLTPLIIAARHGHTEVARTLLAHHTHIDTQDTAGRTALMYAAKFGYKDLVLLLLDHQANTSLRDMLGCTALWWAQISNHTIIVKILEQHNNTV